MGATAKASSQGLEKVKQAITKKGWRKTSPVFSDAACVSAATLKRFWRGIPIGLDSFESICRVVNVEFDQVIALNPWMESARSPNPNNPTNNTSANDKFIDKNSASSDRNNSSNSKTRQIDSSSRQALRQSLRHQLLGSVRVLAITGLTGIGKTTLAHQLASDITAEGYCQISLTCNPTSPLTLASLAHALSKHNHLDSFAFSLSGLSDRLTAQKYLFIIDNCEHLLTSNLTSVWGEFQSSAWHPFFQSILNAPSYNSRFILTSQDTPSAIDLSQQQQPARGHICVLAGLTPAEQTTLFRNAGLTAPKQSDSLTKIGQAYAGHPLALKTIAQDIATNHQHSASAYWKHTAVSSLHDHSQALQSAVQPRLVQTLARLKNQSPDAFNLLCASSPYPTPLTGRHWMQIAQGISLAPGYCWDLLDLLCDRALIIPTVIQNRLHFYPHPLIRSLMLTQIHGTPQTAMSRATQPAHKAR